MLKQPSSVSSSDSWTTGLLGPTLPSSQNTDASSIFNTRTTATAPLFDRDTRPPPPFPLFQDSKSAVMGMTSPASQNSLFRPSSQVQGFAVATQDENATKLSEEDLKAFRADHFTLGEIPEHPPPADLC